MFEQHVSAFKYVNIKILEFAGAIDFSIRHFIQVDVDISLKTLNVLSSLKENGNWELKI